MSGRHFPPSSDATIEHILRLLSAPRRPVPPPTPEQLARYAAEAERDAWNAEVDKRKAEKLARKEST